MEKNSTIIFPLPLDLLAGLMDLPRALNGRARDEPIAPGAGHNGA